MIRGKISPDVVDPAEINSHLNEATEIEVLETRVGTGKPKYELLRVPEWNKS